MRKKALFNRRRYNFLLVSAITLSIILFRFRIHSLSDIKIEDVLATANQKHVTSQELSTWPSYTDASTGITFKYPPLLRSSEIIHGRVRSNNGDPANYHSIHFYGITTGDINNDYHSLTKDSQQDEVWNVQSDRLVFRIEESPYTKENITTIPGYWKNPHEFRINGIQGYEVSFLDENCGYVHYVFPNTTRNKIVKLTFSACKDAQELVRLYRKAILSTLGWS